MANVQQNNTDKIEITKEHYQELKNDSELLYYLNIAGIRLLPIYQEAIEIQAAEKEEIKQFTERFEVEDNG